MLYNNQNVSSKGVTILPLCPTPIWRAHLFSKESSCFYLLSCLDIEIHPPKLVLGLLAIQDGDTLMETSCFLSSLIFTTQTRYSQK